MLESRSYRGGLYPTFQPRTETDSGTLVDDGKITAICDKDAKSPPIYIYQEEIKLIWAFLLNVQPKNQSNYFLIAIDPRTGKVAAHENVRLADEGWL